MFDLSISRLVTSKDEAIKNSGTSEEWVDCIMIAMDGVQMRENGGFNQNETTSMVEEAHRLGSVSWCMRAVAK